MRGGRASSTSQPKVDPVDDLEKGGRKEKLSAVFSRKGKV